MMGGSKAMADHQASAQVDVKSQENWARWAEKLQTQTPLQTAIPTPGPQVIPSQPHRVGFWVGQVVGRPLSP